VKFNLPSSGSRFPYLCYIRINIEYRQQSYECISCYQKFIIASTRKILREI